MTTSTPYRSPAQREVISMSEKVKSYLGEWWRVRGDNVKFGGAIIFFIFAIVAFTGFCIYDTRAIQNNNLNAGQAICDHFTPGLYFRVKYDAARNLAEYQCMSKEGEIKKFYIEEK